MNESVSSHGSKEQEEVAEEDEEKDEGENEQEEVVEEDEEDKSENEQEEVVEEKDEGENKQQEVVEEDEEKDESENEDEPIAEEPNDSEELMKNYEFDGETYFYTDKVSNVTYRFDRDKNEWIVTDKEKNSENKADSATSGHSAAAGAVYGFENDTHTYTDPSDGSTYMWDKGKNAWFPKVDDDFMARYQMSYGFVDPNKDATPKPNRPDTSVPEKVDKERKKEEAKRKAAEPPTWFEIDQAHNTAIYISNLPLDITMDELTELVSKAGLVARDEKNKNKIKLYRDGYGEPKGDALCTYIKIESVDLALKVLDGSQLRGKTLSIQRAKFQLKGQYDPGLKPKRKKNQKERQKKIQAKLFDWRPEPMRGEPLKCERVVVIKNLFSSEDFDKEPALILEYRQDLRSECLKCGDVKKVVIQDRHPEGVAQVTFSDPAEAQACVQLLNGRWFAQRKLSAEIWDGKTKYKVVETEAEIEARLDKWDKYLEGEDEKKAAAEMKANEGDVE